MEQNWAVYMCRVNDELASILVDLALWDVAPNPRLPVLGWVFVEMNNARPDGLPSAEEAPQLRAIEDALSAALAPAGGMLAGLLGNAGRREMYFYMPEDASFALLIEKAMQAFPTYRYECDSKLDTEWTQYLDLLYPAPAQRRSIENQKVLAQLRQHGDICDEPREIDHFVYLPSDAALKEYASWAEGLGFKVVPTKSSTAQDDGLQLTRIDTADLASIDEVTNELEARALVLGGKYDGWGSPVVRGVASTKKGSWLKRLFP